MRAAVTASLAIVALAAALIAASAGAGSETRQSLPGDPTDPTRLPIGDGRVSTGGPQEGWIFACAIGTGGGAFVEGPWIKSDGTFDYRNKAVVDGSVVWPGSVQISSDGTTRTINSNGLPSSNEPTGVFPIQTTDDAYSYDRNPNSIAAQSVSYSLPAKPQKAASPSCIRGTVGVAKNGVAIFDGLDAGARDAVAHEVQDGCAGHPQAAGVYHYHSLPTCLNAGKSKRKHSKLVGWILDGFPIFGYRGKHGELLTDADLDVCHGHTHRVKIDGKKQRIYHYHATLEYPYTVGCYAGTPVSTGPPGGAPPG